ncbi:hypothetical protein HV95_32620 [Pseudomonas aeruginosa]|nr:hypothetical protein HV95_32620 [Pseudomonas aeruginosa]
MGFRHACKPTTRRCLDEGSQHSADDYSVYAVGRRVCEGKQSLRWFAVTFRRRQHEISKVDRTVFSDVGVASENGK